MTKIYEKEQLEEIVAALKAGQTIAFPTDTVYGLGVISSDAQALERLKQAKGRPENKPVPTMVSSLAQLRMVACVDERSREDRPRLHAGSADAGDETSAGIAGLHDQRLGDDRGAHA